MKRPQRAATLKYDLLALQHNFQQVKELASQSRIMPVVKANAYGHGMLRIAEALPQADGFAVAQLNEAIYLRQSGIQQSITVFQGFDNASGLQQCIEFQLRPVISQLWQLDLIQQRLSSSPLDVWLKINTGMGRLGLQSHELDQAERYLNTISGLSDIGLMTHFANADDLEHPSVQQQLELFSPLPHRFSAESSVSNSAAIIRQLCPEQDWVRPGLMLYGASPILGKSAKSLNLKPVMSLSARLIAINPLRKGQSVGYGHRWTCPEDMPVGIVNIGYGDGYPRHAEDGTPVMINQQPTQLIGRVSMDSIAVDLRNIQARCGDQVELWGANVSVDAVAAKASTISYELLCNVGSMLE